MKDVILNSAAGAEMTVNTENLAVNVGSGSLDVLATPVMIMLIEKAACKCIAPFLEDGETTVGTEVNVRHLSATPRGMKIFAEAEITAVNGREITFSVSACDEAGLIGSGTHKRFLVNGEKFQAKADSKLSGQV